MSEKKYDIIVFGASGFTGQFVVAEIARTIGEENPNLKWAVAGRNMKRLSETLIKASKETGKNLEDTPIVIADVSNASSLENMCKDTRLVLNCVGPYRFFGDAVVRACIQQKTHHIDISGEPGFLEKMQLLYDSKCKSEDVFVIGACGFDSIPSDMGLLYTQQQFKDKFDGAEAYLEFHAGPDGTAVHYGTWHSAIYGYAFMKDTISQRKLLFPEKLPKPENLLPKRGAMHSSSIVNGDYCIPFLGSDRSVVMRTQRFNLAHGKAQPVQFNIYYKVGSFFNIAVLALFGAMFGLLTKFSFGRTLLEKFPRFFSGGLFSHEGPSLKQIAGTSFSLTFVGYGKDSNSGSPKKLVTRVFGPEPGYITTPICMVQAGYVLLANADKLSVKGGVLTAGAAFQDTDLISRLDTHGIKFTTID